MLKKCKYIPRLETSRLILREISEKDTELLFIDPRPNVKRKPSSDFIWGLIRDDMAQKE